MSARGQAAGQPAMPEALRGFLEQLKFNPSGGLPNLDGLVNRPPARTPDIVPDGGQFLERSYANEAGSRAYKLYVPSGYHGQALPLVVMLHGCTQSPDDFAAGTRMNELAEEQAFLVAYPAQAASANHGEMLELVQSRRPAARSGRALADRRHHPPDHARVRGRSRRASMSPGSRPAGRLRPSWAATYPDLYAAVGVHSGPRLRRRAATCRPPSPPCGRADASARHGRGGGRRAAVPTIVFHGDRTAPCIRATAIGSSPRREPRPRLARR